MQGLSRYPNDKKREKFLIEKHSVQLKKILETYFRTPVAPCAEKYAEFQMIYHYFDKTKTRPSVSHAKDWFGQLILIPGLESGSSMDVITLGQ